MCGSNCCIKHWLELRNYPIGTQLMHAHQLVGLSTCTDKDTSSTSLLLPEGHREREHRVIEIKEMLPMTQLGEKGRGEDITGTTGPWGGGGMGE